MPARSTISDDPRFLLPGGGHPHMNCRAFITLLGAAAVAWPLVAAGQSTTQPTQATTARPPQDVSDLVVAIDFDDVMSPTRCEYLTIETTGALVWYDHESWQLGEPPGEADDLAAFEQRVEQVRENISFDGSLFALIYKGEAQGSWQSFSAATQADEVMAPASAESEHRGSGVLRFPAPGGE